MDGSNLETLLSGLGSSRIHGIAVDPAGGKLYWTNRAEGAVYNANLDGSNPTQIISGLIRPHDLAIDFAAQKLYIIDTDDNVSDNSTIYRSDLDGNNLESLLSGLDSYIRGIALGRVNSGSIYLPLVVKN